MTPDSGAACDVFVTMVHGTWPRKVFRDVFLTPLYGRWPGSCFRKNLWFVDGSEFRNRLTAALSNRGLSAQLSPFLWSGANSVQERDRAAHQLVEHIRAKQSDYPSSTQVIVAHSHGGNVVLRALDQLGPCGEIFTATIATPFVEILRTKLSLTATRRIDIMVGATGSIFILLSGFWYTHFRSLEEYFLAYICAMIGPLGCTLPYFLVAGLRARNTRKLDELVRLTSLSPFVRKHPLLVLRAPDDEASLALAAATIGNRLSQLFEWLSYKLWALLLLPLILLVVLTVVLVILNYFWFLDELNAPSIFQSFFGFFFDWTPTLGTWFILAFFGFLFSPGPFNSAYGRELLPIFQGCEINSHSAPDSIDRQSEFQSGSTPTNWGMVVTLHQAEEARRGLRHGLYNDPQCAEEIAAWLQFELARRER